jgi:peroxiredoxin
MKSYLFCLLLFFSSSIYGQTEEERRFLDTLKMGTSYLLGKELPKFEVKSLTGQRFSNESLNNKITVLNFWFEACSPCVAETGALNELVDMYRDKADFQFLSFTFDNKEAAGRFAVEHEIKYPIISLSHDAITPLNFRKGYPTTIITDKTGKIIYFEFGGAVDPEKARKYIIECIYPVLDQRL